MCHATLTDSISPASGWTLLFGVGHARLDLQLPSALKAPSLGASNFSSLLTLSYKLAVSTAKHRAGYRRLRGDHIASTLLYPTATHFLLERRGGLREATGIRRAVPPELNPAA